MEALINTRYHYYTYENYLLHCFISLVFLRSYWGLEDLNNIVKLIRLLKWQSQIVYWKTHAPNHYYSAILQIWNSVDLKCEVFWDTLILGFKGENSPALSDALMLIFFPLRMAQTVKLTCNMGKPGSIPGLREDPWKEGNGNPISKYTYLEKSHGQRVLEGLWRGLQELGIYEMPED